MIYLPDLYHWSPKERREDILKCGLQVYSEGTTHADLYRWPYICFGFTPSSAWSLSGDLEHSGEIEVWDLWQFYAQRTDDLRIRHFGNELEEVKVYNSIPADRLWHVGTRDRYPSPKKPKAKRKPRKKK